MDSSSTVTPSQSLHDDCGSATPVSEKRRDPEQGSIKGPSQEPASTARAVGLVATVTLAQLINISCSQALNVALPSVGVDLSIDESQLQWIVSANAITFGSFLLLFARIADLYGRKLVFMLGTVWLLAWCIGCALAPTKFSLIFMRALQGMGSAANTPAALGILGHAFPSGSHSKLRSLAFATFSAGAPMGSALGGVLGGVTAQWVPHIHWRAVFYILAGLSLITSVGGLFLIPSDPPSTEADRSIDWVGAVTATLSLVLLNFSLAQGPSAGWTTAYVLVLLVASVILLALFVPWEYYQEKRRNRSPLIRLDIFRAGRVSVVLAIAFFAWACFSGFLFWATIYYQTLLKYPPIQVTLRFLPTAIVGFLVNIVAALALPRISGQVLIIIGATGTALAAVLFAVIKPSATYWTYGFFGMSISVFGADFIFSTGTLYIATAVRPSEQAMAGGVFITLTQVGIAVGLAIQTIVYNAGDPTELRTYHDTFWACAAFGFVAIALAVVGLGRIGIVGKH